MPTPPSDVTPSPNSHSHIGVPAESSSDVLYYPLYQHLHLLLPLRHLRACGRRHISFRVSLPLRLRCCRSLTLPVVCVYVYGEGWLQECEWSHLSMEEPMSCIQCVGVRTRISNTPCRHPSVCCSTKKNKKFMLKNCKKKA